MKLKNYFYCFGLWGINPSNIGNSCIACMYANSISNIFTLDIYKKYINKNSDENKMVWTGLLTVLVSMIIAVVFTWKDILGIGGEGGFTLIQQFTGLINPGVFAMFILGFFWKRTIGTAALVGLILSFVLAIFFNNYEVDEISLSIRKRAWTLFFKWLIEYFLNWANALYII